MNEKLVKSSNVRHIPALCLTLNPYDPDRAIKAKNDILKLGFSGCHFIMGIDGKKLSNSDIQSITTTRSYHELNQGRYVHEALSTPGSVGCYVGHLECWKWCIHNNAECAIFEDDFTSISSAQTILGKAYLEAVKLGYDILRLAHEPNTEYGEEVNNIGNELIKVGRTQGASAYIITPYAANILLTNALPIEVQVDHYMDMCSYFYDLNHIGSRISLLRSTGASSIIAHTPLKVYPDSINGYLFRRHWKCIIVIFILIILTVYLAFRRPKSNIRTTKYSESTFS